MENAEYVRRAEAWKNFEYDPPEDLNARHIFLDEEHQAEKERLIAEGFSNWTRQDYKNLVKASARHGVEEYALIARELESMEDTNAVAVAAKSNENASTGSHFRLGDPAEIERYAKIFWARG